MEQIDIKTILLQMKDNAVPSRFALKKDGQQEDPDIFIEANRNGILTFCEMLLQSLEQSDVEDAFLREIPDNFHADDSDVYITHIKVANEHRTPVVEQDSMLTQLGCFAALLVIVIIFLVGFIKSLVWIGDLIK